MIPYGRQYIDQDDIDTVAGVLRGDYLTTGPAVENFEKAFCGLTKAKHTIVCSNGTAALHLAVMALETGPGDAAIVPSLTFLSTANAVRFTGAEVVFADNDPQTGLMRPQDLEEALRRCGKFKPKAAIPVHLNGQCADMEGIGAVAKKHGLKLITDCCHAVGGTIYGKPVGSCAIEDMAAFSFHPVKTIAMGEGGAITTNDDKYAERMKRLRTHGMKPKDMSPEIPHYYEMPEPGYNYRASDINCALGLSQLKKLPEFAARRRDLVARYDALLQGHNFITPVAKVSWCDPVWHLYAVQIDFAAAGTTRAKVMTQLKERGVGTQVHYFPVHRQPYYQERYGATALPGADAYYSKILSLPLYYGLMDDQVNFVVDELKKALGA